MEVEAETSRSGKSDCPHNGDIHLVSVDEACSGSQISVRTHMPVPQVPLMAIFVSIVIGISCAGIMFAYYLPGALSTGLNEELRLSSEDVSMLATAYTVPSIITALLAARALVAFGLIPVCFMCVACVHVGSFAFALATYVSSTPFVVMIVAQMINGAGDPLGLACSPAMVARWFRHNHMGLSMGVTLMITQITGAMLPFELLPIVHSRIGLGWTLWIGSLIQFVPLSCLITYWCLERKFVDYLVKVHAADDGNVDSIQDRVTDPLKDLGDISTNRLIAIPFNAWLQMANICFIPVVQYVSLGLMPIYLHAIHDMSEVEAGERTSYVWWFSITAPFWGMLSDSPRIGRLHIQLFGTLVGITCFLLLAAGFSNKFLFTVLGTCFAILVQNSYVCLEAFITDRHLADFTYGVMGALFNVGLCVITYLAGHLPVAKMPLVYVGSLLMGVILTCWLLLRVNPKDAAKKGLLPQRQTRTPESPASCAETIGASADASPYLASAAPS